jgi:hypothetical protein
LPYGSTGKVKGNRAPTIAIPGSKGSGRPAAQKGGGGNKAAGSPEPTASTTPTVTVSSNGTVTAEHFGAGASAQKAAQAAVRTQRQQARRVVALVSQKPDRKPVVAKGTEPKATPANIGFSELSQPKREAGAEQSLRKQLRGLEVENHDAANRNSVLASKAEAATAPQTVTVAAHTRKAPESKLKGTQQERKAARKTLQKAKAVVRKSRVASKLPIPYEESPEQQKVARTVLRTGKEEGATRKELMAAAETGIVEAPYFKNPKGGDADSEGWRQERTSIYGTGPQGPTNVRASSKRFFEEAKSDPTVPGGGGETAGQLAQTVQGSAYPERYEEHRGEAAAIVKAFFGSQPSPKSIKDLAAAKREAKELGLKVGGQGVGPPPKQLVKRTVVAETAMKEIEGEPYIWGGGHGSFTEAGKDCSGAVGYVLNKVEPKVMTTPLTSGSMGSVLKPGPGALTVYYNAGHTFISYVNRKGQMIYWGTSVGDSGAGGLGPHPTPSASYLAEYSVGHVPGMGKKQALQLGAEPGSLTGSSPSSFPGMTFSPSGTTATITESTGKPGKPGFSKLPIKPLSAPQQMRQAEATLKAGDLAAGKEAKGPTTSILDALAKKYGA